VSVLDSSGNYLDKTSRSLDDSDN